MQIRNKHVSHVTFFLVQKITFFVSQKHVTIRLSFFVKIFGNNFVIFSIRICTRVKKFLKNGQDRCPKIESTKPFCENSTRTR